MSVTPDIFTPRPRDATSERRRILRAAAWDLLTGVAAVAFIAACVILMEILR